MKRQPKGIPVGGQFAANEHDEAASTMRGRPASESLERALDHWGLSESDVPGIGDAWDERFEILADDTIVGASEIALDGLHLRDSYGVDDPRDVRVYTRGSRTEVEFDERGGDDDDDYTSRDTTYRIPVIDDELNRRIIEALDDAERVLQRDRLRREAETYASGSRPVWHLLADEEELRQARARATEAETAARSTRYGAESAEAFSTDMSRMRKIVKSGVLTQEQYRENFNRRFKPQTATTYNEGVGFNDAVKEAIEHQEKSEKIKRLDEALADAHALPDGALKDFLVGERPERTYPVTEGTGRNKRTVQKKYRPTSDLVSDHKSAKQSAEYAAERYKKTQQKLRVWGVEHATVAEKHAVHLAAAQESAANLYRMGWSGEGEPPAAPSSPSPW